MPYVLLCDKQANIYSAPIAYFVGVFDSIQDAESVINTTIANDENRWVNRSDFQIKPFETGKAYPFKWSNAD
jgi:hypothetical protein